MRVLVFLALIAAGWMLARATEQLQAFNRSPYPLTHPIPFRAALVTSLGPPDLASDLLDGAQVPIPFVLERGETLGEVLRGHGVEPGEAHSVIEALAEHVDFRRLRAGDPYSVYFDGENRPVAFQLVLPAEGRVRVSRWRDGWRASWHAFERAVEPRFVAGELEDALEASIRRAGGPSTLAYRMADVLQWDIDFNRDLRLGDRFEVLYEQVYLDGRADAPGNVLALTYENRGRRLEAYRYGEEGGYYDAEGRPLRKMFLRSPLPYSRITSRFSHRRFHPVLKTYRPHYGVDYGAPTGTAVRVTAGGVVSFAGWSRGGGKMVKVQHANDYLTAYLHLSGFAKGVRPGRRVYQGDVIGYVGATGLATGPHLDYRVQHRGRWIDPLSIKQVNTPPLPEEDLPAFRRWRDLLRRTLASGEPPDGLLAMVGGSLPRTRMAGLAGAEDTAPLPPAETAGR